jgi:hypothetical protein
MLLRKSCSSNPKILAASHPNRGACPIVDSPHFILPFFCLACIPLPWLLTACASLFCFRKLGTGRRVHLLSSPFSRLQSLWFSLQIEAAGCPHLPACDLLLTIFQETGIINPNVNFRFSFISFIFDSFDRFSTLVYNSASSSKLFAWWPLNKCSPLILTNHPISRLEIHPRISAIRPTSI